MGTLMDLIAGDERDIVLALAIEDVAAFDDPDRFAAHLSLGARLDPPSLDWFSEAVRLATGRTEPVDFVDARTEVPRTAATTERIVERVDSGWVGAVAHVPDDVLPAVADGWIELIEVELRLRLPPEESAWVREVAGRVVAFCRAAAEARTVIFAWGF